MINKHNADITNYIKTKALDIGFDNVGITQPKTIYEFKEDYYEWINNGYHGEMEYLKKYAVVRLNPFLINPNIKSIIICALNYYPPKLMPKNTIQIAKYAYGNDYHKIMKNKLKQLINSIQNKISDNSKYFFNIYVDSGPFFEKIWAEMAGIGKIGKNSLLIIQNKGSFFFLGLIITNLILNYDTPSSFSPCKNCNLCIDACPTNAIISPKKIDTTKCISYLTIESKKTENYNMYLKNSNYIFGCDTCQDVCPHNKKINPTKHNFNYNEILFNLNNTDWINLNEETYNKIFQKTPVNRIGYKRLKKLIENKLL